MTEYSEDALIEQPAIELFEKLGWETANCSKEPTFLFRNHNVQSLMS